MIKFVSTPFLCPVGVVVEMEAGVARVVARQRQEGFRCVKRGRQVLQALIEVDVGIEQQADALALHPAKPLRVGDALIALHHLQLHRGLRQRRRIRFLEQHQLADAGVVQVVAQAFVDLPLAIGGFAAVGLGVDNKLHR